MKEFVQRSEVKAGIVLKADGGFNCLDQHQKVTVHEDAGGLYINCRIGKHYLVGQHGPHGEYVGFYAS